MKGITCVKYGGPELLRVVDYPIPKPKANEILVKIHAAAVNKGDWHCIRGDPFVLRFMLGLLRPRNGLIIGSDVSGVVTEVGEDVKHFKVGDKVYGDISVDLKFGAFAEYVAFDENAFVLKPDNISFEEAAAVSVSAITSLQGLRDHGMIKEGQKVLINGASGGCGSYGVMIAKSYKTEVTAVASTSKLDFVKSLGADHVIDYKKQKLSELKEEYDLILDCAAYRPFSDFEPILAENGIYVLVGGELKRTILTTMQNPGRNRKAVVYVVSPTREDGLFINELIKTNKIKPAIDKVYPLEKAPDAIKYLEDRKVKGKLVISIIKEVEAAKESEEKKNEEEQKE